MSNKRQADADDQFAVLGISTEDTLRGFEMAVVNLGINATMELSSLAPKLRQLARVLRRPVARERLVEVYFAANFLTGRTDDPLLKKFSTVYYMNKAAFDLSRHFGLTLPKVLKVAKRSELPRNIGNVLVFPWISRAA